MDGDSRHVIVQRFPGISRALAEDSVAFLPIPLRKARLFPASPHVVTLGILQGDLHWMAAAARRKPSASRIEQQGERTYGYDSRLTDGAPVRTRT
jgi:hypothetical protein